MTLPVRLSGAARKFLVREASYLRARSPGAAEMFLEKMTEARRNLSLFPELGREGLPVRGLRRLIAGDYILEYERSENSISVLLIRHGRQGESIIGIADDEDYEVDGGA